MTNHPTFGFRTLKAYGSRLVRSVEPPKTGMTKDYVNDWVNISAKEGTSGWKDGLLFLRTYAYQDAPNAHHLYRIEAVELDGLRTVATGYARKNDEAWRSMYRQLHEIGVMPDDAFQALGI